MADEDRNAPSGLADALRRYVDAVAGMGEVSRERADRIMAELAMRGEPRARDLQKAARDLVDRSTRNRRDLTRLIQKEIRRQLETRDGPKKKAAKAPEKKRSPS